MKKLILFWLIFTPILFWEIFFKGYVALPVDTLVGANLPWRDYKWGYSVGVPVKNPPISDVYSQFFVWKRIQSNLLKSGIFPIWNRYSFSGTPLLSTLHSSVLYPTGILFLILPFVFAWNAQIILSIIIAGISMGLYLYMHNKNTLAAIGGSIVFALSGLMTTWSEFGTAIWGMTSIPFALICIDMIIKRPKKSIYFLGLSSSAFAVIAAGNIQIATYYFALTLFYSLYVYRFKEIIKIFLGLLFGIGLASLQLIPTYIFYKDSIRSEEKYSQDFNYGLTSFSEIIRFWAPDYFGNPVSYNYSGRSSYHENSNFIGAIGVVLVAVSFTLRNKSRRDKFFVITFLSSLFLALDNPVSKLIFSLPLPLFTYSSASRIFFITSLSASYLISSAIAEWQKSNLLSTRIINYSVLLILVNLIYLYITPLEYRQVSLRNSVIPIGMFTVLLLLNLPRFGRKYLTIIVLLFLIADLSRYYRKYNPFVPSKLVFPTTPIIEYLQKNTNNFRIINETDEIIPPNTWSYYGLESPEGYDPLHLLSYHRFGRVAGGLTYFGKPSRYLDFSKPREKYLNILSVKYLVAKKRDDKWISPAKTNVINAGWIPVFDDKSVEIYENPHVLPKVFSPLYTTVLKDENEMAQYLVKDNYKPAEELVVIESKEINWPHNPKVNIEAITQDPLGLNFIYSATDSGIVVVSQAYDIGWIAKSGNEKLKTFCSYGGLLGILVPASNKIQVEVRYLPDLVLVSALISGLSLIVVALSNKIIS